MKEALSIDVVQIASTLSECNVLTLHGTDDVITPVEDAYSIHEHLGHRAILKIVDQADHCFTKHQDIMIQEIVNFVTSDEWTSEWINDWIKANAPLNAEFWLYMECFKTYCGLRLHIPADSIFEMNVLAQIWPFGWTLRVIIDNEQV